MTQYILRRLALVAPLLLGITVITYVIISLAPGDPITALINPEEMNVMSKEDLDAQRERLGLNQPLPVRYLLWLGQSVQGNLGFSIQHRQPVQRCRFAHGARELCHLRRLLQITESSVPNRRDRSLETRTSGEDDDRYVEIDVADSLQELDSVRSGHQHVRDDRVETPTITEQ